MKEISAETQRFLEEMPNLILATIRRDGSPQMSPLWYLWRDGRFTISTVTWTAKWKNLQRDARCSVCIDDPGTGQMVVAYGSAELVVNDVRSATHQLVAKYYPGDPAAAEAHMERIFNDPAQRVIISMSPDDIITRRLGE